MFWVAPWDALLCNDKLYALKSFSALAEVYPLAEEVEGTCMICMAGQLEQ